MAYTGVYVFGDSLVDAGNALELAEFYGDLTFSDLPEGAPTSELGYFDGRFSNGLAFTDLLSNKAIGAVTRPIFPYGYEDPWIGIPISPFASDPNGNNLNFAYGGAQVRQGDEAVPDLDGQTDAFKDAVDGDADPGALYIVTMGGNDVRNLAKVGSNPAPQADAERALDKVAQQLIDELSQLINAGAVHIMITGIPDVGLIPKYDRDAPGTAGYNVLDGDEIARSEAATEYSQYLDALIRDWVVPALEAKGAIVTYVPMMDYQDLSGDTVTGGLNAILPTLEALNGLDSGTLSTDLLEYRHLVFFDDVHPTAQAHALFASYAQSLLTGQAWIETLPLSLSDVDYRTTASISAAGEVDRLVVSLVAGTTYTIEMLGISSLSTAGSLADPLIRLIGPTGILVAADGDSGAGFDTTLTFTAATTGNYTIENAATGSLTGSYVFQAAVMSGVAVMTGNTYTINNVKTVVLEGAGGSGSDMVRASISYALSAGSEIEVLTTTNDRGKTAINLTGNEFSQTIVGNNGNNVLEGKGGADVLTGGGGKDVFVLSSTALTGPGSVNVDRISDYGNGDVVDVTQVLNLAAGSSAVSGGYLRVTTSGLVQVDTDGGGNGWITLSTINGSSAVTVRYLSGGVATNISVSRTVDQQKMAAAESAVSIGDGLPFAALMDSSPGDGAEAMAGRFGASSAHWTRVELAIYDVADTLFTAGPLAFPPDPPLIV